MTKVMSVPHILIVHNAPPPGEIAEKKAGKDRHESVGKYLRHRGLLKELSIPLPCGDDRVHNLVQSFLTSLNRK